MRNPCCGNTNRTLFVQMKQFISNSQKAKKKSEAFIMINVFFPHSSRAVIKLLTLHVSKTKGTHFYDPLKSNTITNAMSKYYRAVKNVGFPTHAR